MLVMTLLVGLAAGNNRAQCDSCATSSDYKNLGDEGWKSILKNGGPYKIWNQGGRTFNHSFSDDSTKNTDRTPPATRGGKLMKSIRTVTKWGTWGKYWRCPPKMYAREIRLRSEANQGGGDDTATNGIQIICSDFIVGTGVSDVMIGDEGHFGEFKPWMKCAKGYKMFGFQAQIEPDGSPVMSEYGQVTSYDTRGHDDTGFNGLQVRCRKDNNASFHDYNGPFVRTGQYNMRPEANTDWGRWMKWVTCRGDQFIAGIRLAIEPHRRDPNFDDTSLTDVEFYCRKKPTWATDYDKSQCPQCAQQLEGGDDSISLSDGDDEEFGDEEEEGDEEDEYYGADDEVPDFKVDDCDNSCSCKYVGANTDVSSQFLCQRGDVCYNLVNHWCAEDETVCEIP